MSYLKSFYIDVKYFGHDGWTCIDVLDYHNYREAEIHAKARVDAFIIQNGIVLDDWRISTDESARRGLLYFDPDLAKGCDE